MTTSTKLAFATCCAIASLLGCGGSAPAEITPYQRPVGETTETPSYQMMTLVETASVRAGETARVSCMLSLGGKFYLPETAIDVTVTPAADVVVEGNGATITARTAGTYVAVCQSADGKLVDPAGAVLEIRSRLPASWTVTPPTKECFSQIDRFELDASVRDTLGNEVTDAQVEASVSPNHGFVGNAATGLRFLEDGDYQVTFTVVSAQDPASTIEPQTFAVNVDATPPVIELTSPSRGAMLQQGSLGNVDIQVTGTARDDATGIRKLTINGIDLPVSGNNLQETINVSQTARWGLSVVSGHAEDACGNVGYVAVPFLRSPSYYPASTYADANARVGAGFEAQVSQLFIDDGDRSDLDDLATLGQTIFDNTDFDSMLAPGAVLTTAPERDDCDGFPGPTFISTGFVANRHPDASRPFTIEPTLDHLAFVSGGIDFSARIDNFNFPLRVNVTVVQCALGAPTIDTITVDATVGLSSLSAAGVIGADVSGNGVAASVEAIDFSVNGLYLDIDCGFLDWACDGITGLIMGAAEGMLEVKVEEAMTEMVPPMLADMLSSFSVTTAMDLPAPLGMTLNVGAALDRLTLCGANAGMGTPAACNAANSAPGSLGFGVGMQMYPSARGANIPANAKGSIQRGGVSPQFNSAQSSFGVGVKTDMINQMLWALWYGGALDIPDLSAASAMVPAGMSASLNAMLPPVLMPGENGNLFELGLGGLQVEGSINITPLLGDPEGAPYYVDISMTVSAIVGAQILIDQRGRLTIKADADPEFYFEIHSINDLAYGAFLGERLADTLSGSLSTLLGAALGEMELPSFDLSATMNQPVGTTVWGLNNAGLSNTDGYVALSGVIGPVQ